MRGSLVAMLLLGCGSSAPVVPDASLPDAATDVTIEASFPPLPDCTLDGGTISDWPGWHRTRAFNGCCMTDVPDDVVSAVPPLTWVPCDGGTCTSLDMTWDAGNQLPSFLALDVSRGDGGNAQYLRIGRSFLATQDDSILEWDVYDVSKNAPAGAWRAEMTEAVLAGECDVAPMPTPNGVALLGEDWRADRPYSVWSGWSDVDTAMRAPNLTRFGGKELIPMQDFGVSDTTFAFDTYGALGSRTELGSSSYVHAVGTPALLEQFVQGHAAFYESEYGNNGWAQMWRLDADGSSTLVRQLPNRHVAAFATDGETLFWVEAEGPNPILSEPMDFVEVWAAPYSTDPSLINANAHRLASFAGARVPAYPIAFHGTYVLNTLVTDPAWHAVRIDGTVADIQSPFANTYIHYANYVDQTELWATVSGINGPPDFALIRMPLPAFK